MEIEGLKVVISAEVRKAISEMQKFQKVMDKNEEIIKKLEKMGITGHKAQRRIVELTKKSKEYSERQKDLINKTEDLSNFFLQLDKAQRQAYRSQTIIGRFTNVVERGVSKLGLTVRKHTENIKGFLTKWKMGWIAVGTAAIGSLYALAKTSSYMSLWFEEAGGILQYFADSALAPLDPIVEDVLEHLLKFSDWFAKLPPKVRGAVGALGTVSLVIGAIASAIKLLTTFLKWVGLGKLIDLIIFPFKRLGRVVWAVLSRLGSVIGRALVIALRGAGGIVIRWIPRLAGGILGVFGAVLGAMLTVTWILDKLGLVDKMIQALNIVAARLKEKVPTVFNLAVIITAPLLGLGRLLIDIVRGQWDKILPDLKRITWERVGNAWQDLVKRTGDVFRVDLFNTIKNALTGIGSKIWNKIKEELHTVSKHLKDWASGILGASPTLIQIGKMIPKTLMAASSSVPIDIHKTITTIMPAPTPNIPSTKSTVYNVNISPNINISNPVVRDERDVRDLANKLSEYWRDDITRIVRGVV